MVSALGQNAQSALLASQGGQRNLSVQNTIQRSISNPLIKTGSLIGAQNATNLLSSAVSSMQNILDSRSQRQGDQGPLQGGGAAQALFGNATQGLLTTLQASSQAQIQQTLQGQGSSPTQEEQQQLTRRLSQLSIERLAILDNALKDNPEIEVPEQLARSVASMTENDREIFKNAVTQAIENVLQRQQAQTNDGTENSSQPGGSNSASINQIV